MVEQKQQEFYTYFDFKYIFEALYKVKQASNSVSKCFHIKQFNFKLSDKHNDIIAKAIELRKEINSFTKDLGNVVQYRRANEADIDLKSITSEYVLSTMFFNSSKFNKSIKIKAPAIAEINLKQEPDFLLESNYENQAICFDLKSQWSEGSKYLTINIKSHNKYLEQNDFYCVCLIDRNESGKPTHCHFFVITKKFFEDNAEAVMTSTSEKFSPYYKIEISKILESKKV